MLKKSVQSRLSWLLPFLILLSACSSNAMQSAYIEDYRKALSVEGVALQNDVEAVKGFIEVFNQVQHGDVASIINETYAETLYFNDTFRTITNRNELIDYMQHTGQQVDRLEVKIEDIAMSKQDIYVRWVMRMQFSVMGKKIDSESIGISQLRFDKDGKIILHQDFWDGVDGFYQYLPIIGYSLRKIRNQL
ncbi:nuclear transport factor 2 family protein [Methylophaga sp. SB9B]|uniref:nuclear transport factor 2 family protein n=1 Tax=Methylophaga sp. SB9B TaxID=2570356 RepID=UPI0010A8800A|nr:nuclear transport factor 2 family protein [Methylophaga sp. SB9B]THK40322.1 nuclear transport factor 2 family protein [Methylophaga sp. SB9B]